ncbi:MAG: hypothetical protein KTR22_14385 [Flavobacteriaceae bacterium]|nr:hypothetical protein [Flavobacteriaceae bacterium]
MESLNPEEITYLQLLVYGYTEKEIEEFMSIANSKQQILQVSLEMKFGTQDWKEIIQMAFKKGILHKQDFVENPVRVRTDEMVQRIYSEIKASSREHFGLKISIKRALTHYLARMHAIDYKHL